MMFIVFIAFLLVLLIPEIKLVQQKVPTSKHKHAKSSNNQYIFIKRKPSNWTWKRYLKWIKSYNKKMWAKKINLLKWYLEIGTLTKYPHYRRNKKIILITKYKSKVNWRIKHPLYALKYWMIDLDRSLKRLHTDTRGMADFYFSGSGDDDTGDGSIGNPWKTEEKFIDESSGFSPGDNLYFNRGDNFRASVNGGTEAWIRLQSSGTSLSKITMTAYGSGDKPIVERIYGDASHWTFDNIHVDNTDRSDKSWFDFAYGTADGISIIDCDMDNSNSSGIRFSGAGNYSDLLITGCSIDKTSSTGGSCMYIEAKTGGHATDISIYDITVTGTNTNNASVITIHEANSATSGYIEGPVLIHTISIGAGAIREEWFDIVTGTYGELYNVTLQEGDDTLISYGHSAGCNEDTSNGRWHIHHCIFEQTDSNAGITISGRNCSIYCCLLIGHERRILNFSDYLYSTRPAPGTNTAYTIDGNRVYYCTFIDEGITGSYGMIGMLHDSTSGFETGGIVVRNCIFTTTQASMSCTITRDYGTHGGSYDETTGHIDTDYNFYYDPGGNCEFSGPGTELSDVQLAGYDANSTEGDPGLVDRTGGTDGWPNDAKLDTGSDCIGAGTPINTGNYYNSKGEATVGIRHDYFGTALDGSTPDIGFHTFSAGVPATPPNAQWIIGEGVELKSSDDLSDFDFVVNDSDGAKLTNYDDTHSLTGNNLDNEGTCGDSTNTQAPTFNGTVSGCGTYEGAWDDIRPESCDEPPSSEQSTKQDTAHDRSDYIDEYVG